MVLVNPIYLSWSGRCAQSGVSAHILFLSLSLFLYLNQIDISSKCHQHFGAINLQN